MPIATVSWLKQSSIPCTFVKKYFGETLSLSNTYFVLFVSVSKIITVKGLQC